MTRPLVSVIIPTYNCAPYLPAAIESVRAQTLRDYEIIIVDDGSTDNTPEVLAPYRHHVRYLAQPNRGVSAARNRGIAIARGMYIAFLDADDEWMPDKLERQINLFAAPARIDAVFSDYWLVDPVGRRTRYFATFDLFGHVTTERLGRDGHVVTDPRFFEKVLQHYIMHTSTFIAARRCFEVAGRFDPSLRTVQDTHLWLRMCKRLIFGFVDAPLATRRLRAGSLITDEPLFIREHIKMYQELPTWVPNVTAAERRAIRDALDHYWYPRAYRLYRDGSRIFRRHYFLLALAKDFRARTMWLTTRALLPRRLVDTMGTLHWRWNRYLRKSPARSGHFGDAP